MSRRDIIVITADEVRGKAIVNGNAVPIGTAPKRWRMDVLYLSAQRHNIRLKSTDSVRGYDYAASSRLFAAELQHPCRNEQTPRRDE